MSIIDSRSTTDPEIPDETEKPDETLVKFIDNEINAAEATETTVTVKTLIDVTGEVADDKGNKKTETVEEEGAATDADVFFTNGCVNGDKLVKGKDLTFKITAGEDHELVSWGSLLNPKDGVKPSLSTLFPAECKVTPKKDTKSIAIYVKTKIAGYKVTFKGADGVTAGTDFDIYEFAAGEDGSILDILKKTPIAAADYSKVLRQGEEMGMPWS